MANTAPLGLIVPPSNPTLEVEIRQLLGKTPHLYTSRLPFCQSPDLALRNQLYLESCLDTAQRFGTLPLRGIIVGCTGAFYGLGPELDQRQCEDHGEQLGRPYCTASLASLLLIRQLGFTRVQLELPYPDWLIERAVAYFSAAGLEIVAARSLLHPLGVSHPYEIEEPQLTACLRELHVPPKTLVFLSGTGMFSLAAHQHVVHDCHVPLLSTNICITNWLLGLLGNTYRGSRLMRQLMRKLMRYSPQKLDRESVLYPKLWR